MSEPKLLFCGVRDGGDFWHLECRFEDGQKFAAVQVDKGHERLADEIAAYLNSGHDGVLSGEDARKLLSSLGDVANPDEIAARRVVSRERLTKIEGRADNRKASEQALGLAEIRIRQLGEQLVACDKALAERDARILVLTRDAGRLADEVDVLIRTRVIDSRSPAADALLDFREPPSTPRSDRLAKLDKIVWGLVHNAGRCITSGRVPRWSAVMDAVGCGSTQAHELCRQHGVDPDELVGRGDLCGGCGVDVCPGCTCDEENRQHCTREGRCIMEGE